MNYFSKIERLKRKASRLYVDYSDHLDSLDCGANLAEHISPILARKRLAFDEVMAQLIEIDQNAPCKHASQQEHR